MAEQADRNRKSIKPQTFINEIKATDTLNLEFNDSSLTNLTFLLYINAVYTTIVYVNSRHLDTDRKRTPFVV